MSSLFGNVLRNNVSSNNRVIMLGFEDSGKTSILCRLLFNEFISCCPKTGPTVETVHLDHRRVPLDIWDLSGSPGFRRVWRDYLDPGRFTGLIFVVDGSLPGQTEEVDQFLELMNYVIEIPVLLFVNKVDLPPCRSMAEIVESFNMHSFNDRLWHVQDCSAFTGDGVKEGLTELSKMITCYTKINP